jgi:hypothetical protein
MSTITRAPRRPTGSPLLDQPVVAVLTTICVDGRLQSTPVWFLRDGTNLLRVREGATAAGQPGRHTSRH